MSEKLHDKCLRVLSALLIMNFAFLVKTVSNVLAIAQLALCLGIFCVIVAGWYMEDQ